MKIKLVYDEDNKILYSPYLLFVRPYPESCLSDAREFRKLSVISLINKKSRKLVLQAKKNLKSIRRIDGQKSQTVIEFLRIMSGF